MAKADVRKSKFGQKQSKLLMDILVYLVLSIVGIIFILPFAWMVANSLKDIRGIYRYPPYLHTRSLAIRELYRGVDGHQLRSLFP